LPSKVACRCGEDEIRKQVIDYKKDKKCIEQGATWQMNYEILTNSSNHFLVFAS
jgi:hypothetical protein